MNSRIAIRARSVVLLLALALYLAGCGESSLPNPNGRGAVRGINAIATAPILSFQIEERPVAASAINFREVYGFQEWDGFEYAFNFDYLPPGTSDRIRLASQLVDVVNDMEYTLAITGSVETPSIVSWETEERVWDGTETVFESDFAHLAPGLGEIDVYFQLVDTEPVLGMEIGTLSFGERIPHTEFAEGDYVLTLTAPDDPTTVLYESIVILSAPQQRVTLAIFDPDTSKTSPVAVTLYFQSGSSTSLADTRFPPEVRIVHAGFDVTNLDGYLDENLETLIYSDIAFRETSAYAEVPDLVTPLTLTEAGNPDNVLFEADIQRILDNRRTLVMVGGTDGLATRPLDDAGRPLETFPIVRFTHVATNVDTVDLYELDPDTTIDDDVIPKFAIQPTFSTEFFATDTTGLREFRVTLFLEEDDIAVPLLVDLENGDIVDVVIVDTADPAVVELLVFDSTLD